MGESLGDLFDKANHESKVKHIWTSNELINQRLLLIIILIFQ